MKISQTVLISSFSILISSYAFALTDGEITEIMMTANKAEIEAAKVAKSKAADSNVKDFAKHMIDEHEKNEKEGKKVAKEEKIKAKSNEDVKNLKQSAKTELDDLKKKKGVDFDRAYIDNQVTMHEQLLSDLEQKFIPQAQNPQLKSFLTETKSHVEQHLAKAKEIQSSLTK